MASEDASQTSYSYTIEKNLQVLLDALGRQDIRCELSGRSPDSVTVTGLAFDSRAVRPGNRMP